MFIFFAFVPPLFPPCFRLMCSFSICESFSTDLIISWRLRGRTTFFAFFFRHSPPYSFLFLVSFFPRSPFMSLYFPVLVVGFFFIAVFNLCYSVLLFLPFFFLKSNSLAPWLPNPAAFRCFFLTTRLSWDTSLP